MRFQALALDLAGKPQEGVTLNVRAVARITTTSRKRMVGGFYTYDNKTEVKEIGTVCSGKSDARGAYVSDRPISPQDVASTVYHHLGITAEKVSFPDAQRRPTALIEEGRPIRELVG